jgi:hypothetical protein
MTVRINKQKINLREKLAGVEDKVNFDEVVRGLGENTAPLILNKDGGNVGIGTTSPSCRFHVRSGDEFNFNIDGSTVHASARFTATAGERSIALMSSAATQSNYIGSMDSNHQLRFFTTRQSDSSRNTHMTITEGGNVGIGTTNPATTNRLQIMAGVNTQPLFVGSDSGSVCTMNRDTTDGYVLRFEKNGVLVGHISTNSNSLPSDRNFKRNITDLKLGLDFVSKLKPSVYNYKIDDEDCPVHYGLIAQDVESALEECGVEKNSSLMLQHSPTEKEEESDYSLDYGKLVPVLAKAIQEQQQLIEDLKSRIETLEQQ